jgi:hypothetical protein
MPSLRSVIGPPSHSAKLARRRCSGGWCPSRSSTPVWPGIRARRVRFPSASASPSNAPLTCAHVGQRAIPWIANQASVLRPKFVASIELGDGHENSPITDITTSRVKILEDCGRPSNHNLPRSSQPAWSWHRQALHHVRKPRDLAPEPIRNHTPRAIKTTAHATAPTYQTDFARSTLAAIATNEIGCAGNVRTCANYLYLPRAVAISKKHDVACSAVLDRVEKARGSDISIAVSTARGGDVTLTAVSHTLPVAEVAARRADARNHRLRRCTN